MAGGRVERPDRGESGEDRGPGVLVFPPLLFLGTIVLGLLAHLAFPLRPLPPVPARIAGALLLVGAGVLAWTGERAMKTAGTNVDPRQPSTAIVSSGPFRFSRNPLYVAMTLVVVAIALLADAAAPLILLPVMLAVLHLGVVRREERYLEAKFGDSYRAYRSRVRRYL